MCVALPGVMLARLCVCSSQRVMHACVALKGLCEVLTSFVRHLLTCTT